MPRKRATSNVSSVNTANDQELGSMYDYLAKIILLGPSGAGKSCLLHRFVKGEWRVLCSQTIGVEFASKVVKVGSGPRRKRIKLQLWDTAGTERFRAVSRSYYRGAAGAILVYDVSSHASFRSIPTFLHDARTLASPDLTVILAGNKSDTANETDDPDDEAETPLAGTPLASSFSTRASSTGYGTSQRAPSSTRIGTRNTATVAEGREVSLDEASRWASSQKIPVAVEVSALSGDQVTELFERLAAMILTKIELGVINPNDPQSGIQYGDTYDGSSIQSQFTAEDGQDGRRSRRKGRSQALNVFRLDGGNRQRCC